jgi:hypothetical protein
MTTLAEEGVVERRRFAIGELTEPRTKARRGEICFTEPVPGTNFDDFPFSNVTVKSSIAAAVTRGMWYG